MHCTHECVYRLCFCSVFILCLWNRTLIIWDVREMRQDQTKWAMASARYGFYQSAHKHFARSRWNFNAIFNLSSLSSESVWKVNQFDRNMHCVQQWNWHVSLCFWFWSLHFSANVVSIVWEWKWLNARIHWKFCDCYYCYSHVVIENRVQSGHKLANAHSAHSFPTAPTPFGKNHTLCNSRNYIHINGIATPF